MQGGCARRVENETTVSASRHSRNSGSGPAPRLSHTAAAASVNFLDRRYVKEVHDFVTYLVSWFRWLAAGILQDSGDLLQVFDDWQRWLTDRRAAGRDANTGIAPYLHASAIPTGVPRICPDLVLRTKSRRTPGHNGPNGERGLVPCHPKPLFGGSRRGR